MNRAYRILWNAVRHAWVCVAENTAAHRQTSGTRRAAVTIISSMGLALSFISPMALADTPTCVNNTAYAPVDIQGCIDGFPITVTNGDNVDYLIALGEQEHRTSPVVITNTSQESITGYEDAFLTPLYHITGKVKLDNYALDASIPAPLFLQKGRYQLSNALTIHKRQGFLMGLPGVILDHSAAVFTGTVDPDIRPIMEIPVTADTYASGIALYDANYLAIRSPIIIPETVIPWSNPIAALGTHNVIDVYSKLQAGGTTFYAVYLRGSNNVIRLNAGAVILSTLNLMTNNTLMLTAPVVDSESTQGIFLAKKVISALSAPLRINTLSLAGENGDFSFDLSLLNSDGPLSGGRFRKINKAGRNNWTLTGNLPTDPDRSNNTPIAITEMSVEGGTLVFDNVVVPETQQPLVINVTGHNTYEVFHENLTREVLSTSGILQLKSATFTDQTRVNIAAQGKLIANSNTLLRGASSSTFNFQNESILETDLAELNATARANHPWLDAFLSSQATARVLQTSENTIIDTDLSALRSLKVMKDVTIKNLSQLPRYIVPNEHSTLIFKTNFSFPALGTTLIDNRPAATIFGGEALLDREARPEPSHLGLLKFQDFDDDELTPTLVTDLTTEEDLNKIVNKFDQSTLAVAELTTTNGINAGSIPEKFKVWNVVTTNDEHPHNTASALPALTNLRQAYGGVNNLDVTIDKIATDQRVDIASDTTLNFLHDVKIEGQLTGSGEVNFKTSNSRISRNQDFGGTVSVWADTAHTGVTQSVLTLDNVDLPNSWLDIFGSNTTAIGYIKAKEATPTLAPRLFARSASLTNTLDAANDTPTAVGPGVTHLRALRVLDQLEIEALSPTLYTKIETTGNIFLGEESKLLVYMGRFTTATDLNEVLKAGGTITGRFNSVSVNPEATSYFTLTPEYTDDHKVINLKVAVNAEPPATWQPVTRDGPIEESSTGGNENENEHEGNENQEGGNQQGGSGTRPVPDGLLTSIAKRHGRLATVSMARAMDAVVAQNNNNLADFGLLTSHNEDDIAAALSQSMPLLAGTGNRALMDAMREMTRPMATDRCSDPTARHTWASALGDWSRRNSTGGAMGYDANHTGIAVGGDACIERLKHTRLGFTGAYTHTDADSRGTSADQTLKANSWMVGLYGNTPLNDAWDVDFNVNAGRSSVKGTRNLTLANRVAKSKADATLVTAGAGLNWHLMVSDKMTVTPFIRADYSRVAMDAYTETGAKGLNLAVEKQTSQSFVTRVGVKSEWALTPAWSLSATAAVGTDLLDKGHEVSASFTQFPGSAFTVENDRHGRAVADLVLGTSYAITPAVTFSANAIAGVAKGTNHTAIDARVTWKF